MLKKVLWLALACAVLLAALALSRGVRPSEKRPEPKGPAAEVVAEPAVIAPPPKAVEAAPEPTPEDLQMQEDAAAVGMMNADPAPESPESDQSAEPPTN